MRYNTQQPQSTPIKRQQPHETRPIVEVGSVEDMSEGQVRLAPGTLYGALETLVKQRMIVRIPSDDPRRKVYHVTEFGHQTLTQDAQRMQHMIDVFELTPGGAQ